MRRPEIDDPDLPLSELMALWPQTIPVFMKHNMLCVGCMIAPFHTIVDACSAYNLNEKAFLSELMAASF